VGLKDTVTKEYMADNKIFADAFNYFIYNGEQIIKPDNLKPLDITFVEIPFGISGENSPVQKFTDELKNLIIKEDKKQFMRCLELKISLKFIMQCL